MLDVGRVVAPAAWSRGARARASLRRLGAESALLVGAARLFVGWIGGMIRDGRVGEPVPETFARS
jgi:hypothetical protein